MVPTVRLAMPVGPERPMEASTAPTTVGHFATDCPAMTFIMLPLSSLTK